MTDLAAAIGMKAQAVSNLIQRLSVCFQHCRPPLAAVPNNGRRTSSHEAPVTSPGGELAPPGEVTAALTAWLENSCR